MFSSIEILAYVSDTTSESNYSGSEDYSVLQWQSS